MNHNQVGVIYKLFFKSQPNTIYIGKTQRENTNRRLYEHIYYVKKGRTSKVYNWIRKNIDKEELCFEILYKTDDCSSDEIKEIAAYKSNGYILKNDTDGGDGIRYGFKHSENTKTKAKIRARLSDTFKGKNNPFYGKTGAANHKSKPIFQYDLDGNFIREFDSINLAAKELNVGISGIARAYRTIMIAHGYQWREYKADKIEAKYYKSNKLSDADILECIELFNKGHSLNQISKAKNISRTQLTEKIKQKVKLKSVRKKKISDKELIYAKEQFDNGKPPKEICKELNIGYAQLKRKAGLIADAQCKCCGENFIKIAFNSIFCSRKCNQFYHNHKLQSTYIFPLTNKTN